MSKLASAADENGDRAECKDFQGGAAEENPAYRPAPVRPDDDQIASLILRCLDDPLGWMLVLDVPRLATDTGLFGRFPAQAALESQTRVTDPNPDLPDRQR